MVRNGIVHQIPINPLSSRRYTGAFEGGGGEPESVSRLLPGQRELLEAITGQLTPEVGRGITPYGGERVAGMAPLQESAYGIAGDFAPGIQAGLQGFGQYDPAQGLGFLGQGAQALQGAAGPFDPAAATEFWETSMKRPALETWREDVMPSIMEKGVRTAGTADSGPMQRELARSGQRLTTDLSAQLGNLLYSGQQAQLGRQMQGAGMLGQMAGIPGQLAGQGLGMAGQGLGQMAGMGAEQRGIGQQFLGAEQQKWAEAQPWENPWLQQYLATALGITAFDTVVSPQEPSIASQLAPYAWGAATAFSDARLKENFARIDNALEKVNQLEGMTYNFINEDNRSAGIIAQELEKVLPEGVIEHKGLKCIRLDAVVGLLVSALNELNQKVNSRSN